MHFATEKKVRSQAASLLFSHSTVSQSWKQFAPKVICRSGLHVRKNMTEYTGICTDDASQTGVLRMEVVHITRALLGRIYCLIPTIAAAEAGRGMTFFAPLQFFVLENDKNSLRSLLSALWQGCKGLGKASSRTVSECTAESAMGMRIWGRMTRR